MTDQPAYVYAAVEPNPFDAEGNYYKDYLFKRYGEGGYGFIDSGTASVVVTFYDEGHRDEFLKRFGGMKGKAYRTQRINDGWPRPMIGAK